MRRTLIRFFLPIAFASLPALAAALIVAALPPDAQDFYASNVFGIPTNFSVKHQQRARISFLDCFILALGLSLFLMQTVLAYRALSWRGDGFDERTDPWLNKLAQSAEWFPLLGLIGTVAGIMQTFSGITGQTSQQMIINMYAPAITATGSGLFMSLVNILPAWMVLVGRGLIVTLGGGRPAGGS